MPLATENTARKPRIPLRAREGRTGHICSRQCLYRLGIVLIGGAIKIKHDRQQIEVPQALP
jgi:hypothetical protein